MAWTALLLGLVCVATVLLAALGYRSGGLGLGTTIQAIRWGTIGALAGVVLAVLALVIAKPAGARRIFLLVAAAALVLNALVAAPPPGGPAQGFRQRARKRSAMR